MVKAFKHIKQLEEVGFSREQAEAQVEIMVETIEGNLATKQDLTNLKQEMSSIRQELKQDIAILRQDLKIVETSLEGKIQQLEYRLTIKVGTLFIIGFTAFATIMKFWIVH